MYVLEFKRGRGKDKKKRKKRKRSNKQKRAIISGSLIGAALTLKGTEKLTKSMIPIYLKKQGQLVESAKQGFINYNTPKDLMVANKRVVAASKYARNKYYQDVATFGTLGAIAGGSFVGANTKEGKRNDARRRRRKQLDAYTRI